MNSEPIVLIRKKDRIDYILNGLCRYYDITMEELLRRARTDRRYKRKRIAIKILRDIADCSLKDIKYAFNNKSEAAIWQTYTIFTEEIDPNTYGSESLKKEYADVLKYLRL